MANGGVFQIVTAICITSFVSPTDSSLATRATAAAVQTLRYSATVDAKTVVSQVASASFRRMTPRAVYPASPNPNVFVTFHLNVLKFVSYLVEE